MAKAKGKFSTGQEVVFQGFTSQDDLPEGAALMEVGATYTVKSMTEVDGQPVYLLEVPNPDYDPDEDDETEATVTVEAFEDEIAAKGKGKKAAAEKAKAKPAAKGKKASAESEEDEDEDDGEEESDEEEVEAAAPRGKGKLKAAKAAKGKGKKAGGRKAAGEDADEEAAAEARQDHEADPDLRGLTILTEEEEDPEILELIGSGENILEVAQELVQEGANIEWRLGGILYHVRVGKQYKEIKNGAYAGKGGFADYCAAELGLDYRKAMYLCDIYTKFSRLGIPSERLAQIGWTKAVQITPYLDEDTQEDLLEAAEEQSVRDLKETISTSFKRSGGEKKVTKMVRFNFHLEESAAEHTRELFELIKQHLGIEDDHAAFEQMVSEYAQQVLDVSLVRKARRTANARLKEREEQEGEEQEETGAKAKKERVRKEDKSPTASGKAKGRAKAAA